MSRIDFTPAQTTQMPTRASVPRSADSSKLSAAPRWTPPSPPVANTRMPARSARCEVAATVVAPNPRRASTGARSRTPHLATPSVLASASSAASSRPIRTSPSTIAIVAGTAPLDRTPPSICFATRRLSGRGKPWAMIVLSSATTGRPSSRAVRTSSCTRMGGHSSGGRPARGGSGGVVARLAGVVLGEDLVERAAGVGEDLASLVGVAGGGDLHGRGADLEHQAAEVEDALVHAARGGLERVAELLAVAGDVLAALGRELVRPLALGLGGLDQTLVLELLERGVDRAGARLPDALGAALDLLDELVAVLGLLVEEEEHRGADVTAPGTPAATATAVAAPGRTAGARAGGISPK